MVSYIPSSSLVYCSPLLGIGLAQCEPFDPILALSDPFLTALKKFLSYLLMTTLVGQQQSVVGLISVETNSGN